MDTNLKISHSCHMDNNRFVMLLKQKIDEDPELTAAGLASKSGMDNSTIRKLLAGDNQSPKIATAEKICKALGTTLEAFMSSPADPLQEEIVQLYKQLSADERRLLLAAARGIVSESP